MSRFVGIKTAELLDLVREQQLHSTAAWLLTCLLYESDHTTGTWTGTQRQLGEVASIHRTRVKAWLDVLEERALVTAYLPQGHIGWVRVWCYLELVYVTDAQAAKHNLRGRPGRVSDASVPRSKSRKVRLMKPRQKSGSATSEGAKCDLWADERAGHEVAASGLVESTLDEPFALGGEDDEEADRARVLVQKVVDIKSRMRNNTSPPSLEATPGRAAAVGAHAGLASSSSAVPSVTRGSAGGGSEATPVHPRSLNDTPSSRSTTVGGSRDPRAMGSPATVAGES